MVLRIEYDKMRQLWPEICYATTQLKCSSMLMSGKLLSVTFHPSDCLHEGVRYEEKLQFLSRFTMDCSLLTIPLGLQ